MLCIGRIIIEINLVCSIVFIIEYNRYIKEGFCFYCFI